MKKNNLLFLSLVFIGSLSACNTVAASKEYAAKKGILFANDGATDIVIPEKESEQTIKEEAAYSDKLLLNHQYVSMNVNGTETIRGLARPLQPANNLAFKSLDESIATVNENGVVTGVKEGVTAIEVSDKDHPSVKKNVAVYVHTELDMEKRKFNSIVSNMNKVNEDDLKAVVDHELYEKRIYKNNSLHMHLVWDQNEIASITDAYFRIVETDGNINTDNGAMTYRDYEWIFHTNEHYDTYTFHNVAGVKTYYAASMVNYMDEGKARHVPMLDVLDNMFTSGRKIFTQIFDNAKLNSFTEYAIKNYTNVQKLNAGSFANVDGTMFFEAKVNYDDTVADIEDERNYGIPAGTPTPSTYHLKWTVRDNQLIGYSNHGEQTYTIGDDEYREEYDIDHFFTKITDDNRESYITIPNLKEYKEVDYLFAVQ